jgi:predicted nucleic acid-binding protein
MRYAVDTSVAVKLVLPEPDSPKAIKLFDEYAQAIHDLLAPDLFPTEVANVLVLAERSGRLQPGEAMGATGASCTHRRRCTRRSRFSREPSKSPSNFANPSTIAFMSRWRSAKDANW